MSFAYFRWFPGDYARDTRHLTMLQHGAYRHLIDAYMSTGKPIRGDINAICRICGALSGEERQAVEFVLTEFFLQDGPLWRHKRCDRELDYVRDLSEHGRKAAQARWNAGAMPEQCPSNANQNQNQIYKQNALEKSGKSKTKNNPQPRWDQSDAGIEAKGRELGMRALPGETYFDFKNRVWQEINTKMRGEA